MSDRRERPTLQVVPLSMRELAEQRLLVLQHEMVVEAMRTPLLPSTVVLRIAEQGAIPEECVDGDDTVPWCIACESFGTPACLEHGPGHIPARLRKVGRR